VGLRERNAAQTRELILDTALPMFLDRGYEATTMEDIAERAQIGTSTLYRYFPSKDLLLLEPLAVRGHLSAELRARPIDEPLAQALGHALAALVSAPRPRPARLRQIFTVLERASGPRARLLQDFAAERTLLQQAVAERLGRPSDDLFCVMTARVTTLVLELVGELASEHTSDDPATATHEALDLAQRLTETLSREPPVFPLLDAAATRGPGRAPTH
jgi:AcrR family transcriptional regulator